MGADDAQARKLAMQVLYFVQSSSFHIQNHDIGRDMGDQIPEFRQRTDGMDGMEMVAELFGQKASNSGVLLQEGKVDELHYDPNKRGFSRRAGLRRIHRQL